MVGINTNIAAYFSQNNLRTATDKTSNSIARLSSGDKIVRSADDVAGLSIGTVLRTSVNTLRTALTNTFQANSLLNIADGGLKNIGEILQRQKSLAVQATSGTLSASERGFLDQEFQNLSQEIDRLVANTRFNNVVLLNGSLFDSANITTDEITILDGATAIANIGLVANTEFAGTVAELREGISPGEVDSLITAVTPATPGASGFTTNLIANNPAFIGDLGGAQFVVDFVAADSMTVEIQVGAITYRGVIADSTPAADTPINLVGYNTATGAAEGGTFTVNLASAGGTAVVDADEARIYGIRLNDALSKMSFFQNRELDLDLAGPLAGSEAYYRNNDFKDLLVSDIRVTAADGTNIIGRIDIVVDGVTYTETIPANGVFAAGADLTFEADGLATADRRIVLNWALGSTATSGDVTNATAGQRLEDALKSAFRVGVGNTRLTFQTGSKVDDKIDVHIRNTDSNSLFGGEELNILTLANAQGASAVLDNAINYLTSIRADIGALQSRFDYTASNLQTAIQNQDAARGAFLDADIERESTAYATSQVQIQASISVLAQANQLPQNLLKLLG